MRTKPVSKTVWGEAINTLAQTGTGNVQVNDNQHTAILTGTGADLSRPATLQTKAKKKVITQTLAKACMILAEREGDKELKKSFRNTYYCQSQIITHDGRLYGRYCKNRTCTICSGIRKADIINRYLPVMQKWPQPYFVTLTIKACPAKYLRETFKTVLAVFREIIDKYRKRSLRGKGIKLIGIKSLEAEFNPIAKTYNPHLHIIVPNKAIADILVSEWLKTLNRKYKRYTSPEAQKSEPAYGLGSVLVEVIKYGTKIFTTKDVYNKANRKGDMIYAAAKYNIVKAMKGLRIFDRFGFDLPKKTKVIEPAKVVTGHVAWRYIPQYHDWATKDSEVMLTGYILPPELQNLLTYRIDMNSE
jgi:hypothetical protein